MSENTLFLDEYDRPFAVPLLAIEFYAKYYKNATNETSIASLLDLTLSRHCGVKAAKEEDIAYLISRLTELNRVETSGHPSQPARSFNTSYLAFLNRIDTVSLLGLMTNYDLEKMRELYCKVDCLHAKALMKSFIEHQLEKNIVAFEAQLYGSGNKYKGDGEKAVDAESPLGRAQMAALGFGIVDLPGGPEASSEFTD